MPQMKSLDRLLHLLDLKTSGKWFLLSAVIGIVAGLGAIAFHRATQTVEYLALGRIAGYAPGEPVGEHTLFPPPDRLFRPELLLAVMAVGGLISGVVVYSFAPEAEGHGTDAAIEAFHQKRGLIRARIPLVKMITSAITLGTGGSGGREGPIAQIGAGFGSFLGTRLNLSARDRRIMLAAGMGAGVGSIFRAPLAGALFAAEILYRDADLESDVIVPAAMASIIGYSVFSLSLPAERQFLPLFGDQLHYSISSSLELLPLTVLAGILVLIAVAYIKVFYGTRDVFHRLRIVSHLRPMIGATLAGLCGLSLYYASGRNNSVLGALGTGYGVLQGAVEDTSHLGAGILLTVALAKIVTTSLTISSGGSGGVFGPSIVIGGCLGGAVGEYFHKLWPALVDQPQVYVLVGMAGFFSACAHAPISTILMVSEMTGDYKLLLPTMWVSTLCFVLCRRWTLYEKQVPTRLDSPAHRGDFLVDILEGIRVADVPLNQPHTVPESLSLHDILRRVPDSRQNYFPVLSATGALVGVFTTNDVRAYLYDDTLWKLAVARDIMTTNLLTVTPADDLNTALHRFTEANLDELPVVAADDSRRLLGMLLRKEAIDVYNRQLLERRQAATE